MTITAEQVSLGRVPTDGQTHTFYNMHAHTARSVDVDAMIKIVIAFRYDDDRKNISIST